MFGRKLDPEDTYMMGFNSGYCKGFETAMKFSGTSIELYLQRKETEIRERGDERVQQIIANHKARLEKAETPLALSLYDLAMTLYQRTSKIGRPEEVSAVRRIVETLQPLAEGRKDKA